MQESDKIQVYDNQPIRTAWDEQNEEWYFSIVDVVSVLTDQPDRRRAGKYWSVLKTRLKKEGSQLPTNCSQLKLKADDGKRYKTDVANTEQLLRIIQSIPSKKAEPFKLWLAQIGRERIEETIDPELTIDRALDTYSKKGYPADWINQRLQTIRARKELTDQWQTHGVEKGKEYAILTDEVTRAWSGMNTRQYKNLKGLKKENLRDNMSNIIKKVQGVIASRKEELEQLDLLIKARFVEMFYEKGYPVLKWNDVFITTTGKLDSNASVEKGAYPFFTCSKELLRIDTYAFDQEALLLAGNNAAGKYDVKYYAGKFNAYQRTYVLSLKENWSYRLFQYQLEDKLEYLQQQSLGGLTKYLTLKILGELEFVIPPEELQSEFEIFVTQVTKSKVV